jgi:hypothetical protein
MINETYRYDFCRSYFYLSFSFISSWFYFLYSINYTSVDSLLYSRELDTLGKLALVSRRAKY